MAKVIIPSEITEPKDLEVKVYGANKKVPWAVFTLSYKVGKDPLIDTLNKENVRLNAANSSLASEMEKVKGNVMGLENQIAALKVLNADLKKQIDDLVHPAEPPAVGNGNGLLGDYFDNMDLSNLIFSRTDPAVNYSWAGGIPGKDVNPNTWSVRWTGKVQPRYSERYTFFTVSDDGVRLWVDGKQIINNWTNHAENEDRGEIDLEAGKKYDIKLEFFQNTGLAVIRLFWSSKYQAREVVPKEQLYSVSPVIVEPPPVVVPPEEVDWATELKRWRPTDAQLRDRNLFPSVVKGIPPARALGTIFMEDSGVIPSNFAVQNPYTENDTIVYGVSLVPPIEWVRKFAEWYKPVPKVRYGFSDSFVIAYLSHWWIRGALSNCCDFYCWGSSSWASGLHGFNLTIAWDKDPGDRKLWMRDDSLGIVPVQLSGQTKYKMGSFHAYDLG